MAKRKPTSQKPAGKPDASQSANKSTPNTGKPLRGSSVPQSQRKGGR